MSEILGEKMLQARAVKVCNIRLRSLPSLLFLFGFCRNLHQMQPDGGGRSLLCSEAVK